MSLAIVGWAWCLAGSAFLGLSGSANGNRKIHGIIWISAGALALIVSMTTLAKP